jgi:hypothetical protein
MQYSKSDTLLYGTIFDSGSMFLVLVNTSSGGYSIVHKIPGMFTVLKFIVDNAHNRVFLSGPDSTGYPTLMTMNLLTGEVISQVYTPRINNLLYNFSTKKFYAISNRDTTLPYSRPIFSISRIDPNTGLISILADIPHLDNLDPGNETMDEKDNLYIFTGVETTDTSNYLYSIDVITGKVIYKTSVPMYNVYDKDNLIEFRFDNNSQKLYALLWAGKSIEPPVDSSCDLDVQTKLYPNPFGDVLIVEKTQTICSVRMNLYNALGQILIAGQLINDGKNEIHLERLSKGVYFYKFISDAKTVLSGKIIKQ